MGQLPTDTLCPFCGTIFIQPVRRQGGGTRKIYCSIRCAQTDWRLNNGPKRKAHVLKYDSRPENKEQKAIRTRRKTLSKYGLVEQNFQAMLARQKNRCAGCGVEITSRSARVDHDHQTGKVRGLLCNLCNLALGSVCDDRARLYQLAAYLELDRARPVIYLIGSLRNPKIVDVGNSLREAGFECIDNWFSTGEIADDSWKAYSQRVGRSYQEALASREAAHTFYFDRAYIHLSDAAVLVCPAGKSGHIELGYMAGQKKQTYILLDDQWKQEQHPRWDVMTQFATGGIFTEVDTLLTALEELKEVIREE